MSTREPRPIPPANQRIKKYSLIELVKDAERGWVYKRWNKQRHYDMVTRQWIQDIEKTTIDFLSLESRGVRKTQTIKILVQRTGFDPVNIRNYSKIFVVTLRATVPAVPEYADVYLTVVKGGKRKRRRIDGHFIISDLSGQVFGNQKLDWSSKWIKRLPKEIAVTAEIAAKMLDSGEAATIMGETSEGKLDSSKKVVRSVKVKVS